MSNHDELILKIFFQNDKLNISVINKYNRKKNKYYKNIQYYLLYRYIDTETERESLYRIKYNIEDKPTCPICHSKLKFFGRKNKLFLEHCSNSCKKKDSLVNEKWKKSCGDLGTNRQKYKETMLSKYNVDNSYKIPAIIEKIKTINKEKKDISLLKSQQTCLQKYGVKYYLQTDEFKHKSELTSLKKYNTKSPIQSYIVKNKYDWDKIVRKINNTKHKNHTFNTSKEEDIVYNFLVQHFPDIIRSYSSEKYRWNCDFYIPSLDVYIEYNGSHYHNFSPFMNTEEDKNKLNELINKSNKIKESRSCSKTQYDMIIYTWTDLDVRKRHTAKENNLKFIEIWSLNELCDELIDKIKKVENSNSLP